MFGEADAVARSAGKVLAASVYSTATAPPPPPPMFRLQQSVAVPPFASMDPVPRMCAVRSHTDPPAPLPALLPCAPLARTVPSMVTDPATIEITPPPEPGEPPALEMPPPPASIGR